MRFYLPAAAIGLFLLGCCGGCSLSSESQGSDDTISVQLNWYPEAEHGGIYQALADGTYRSANLKVDIRPGGRATPVAPELELGRVDFAMANADDVVAFRREGMDIVAIMAVAQKSPRCILVRSDSGVTSFGGLAGMTLQRQTGRLFLEFMRAKGILDDVKEVPYHGSITSLAADPNIAVQAYSFAEPLLARQQGIDVNVLMVSDLGWNPYSSVLITTGKLIRENPERVQRFVDATRTGWRNYLADPSKGNEAILAANEHGMTAEALAFGASEILPLAVSEEMNNNDVGFMTSQRWEELIDQINAIAPDKENPVKASECFTLQFLR